MENLLRIVHSADEIMTFIPFQQNSKKLKVILKIVYFAFTEQKHSAVTFTNWYTTYGTNIVLHW